jgi:hypothetical protein
VGTNLRLLQAHLGLTLALTASSEAPDFPASNLETGNRQRFWRAASAAEQTLMYDAGAGQTVTCDTVVLPRADLLVAVSASLDVQWSADAATNWTSVGSPYPLVLVTSSHLSQPTGTDHVAEFTSLTKRAWRLRIYGSMTGSPALAGGWFLGSRSEVPINPAYGRLLGAPRTHRGRDLTLSWPSMPEANAETLLTLLAAVMPEQMEGPHETVAGVVYGGRPHYLYDPTGIIFRSTGTPYLLPVLCLTPESVMAENVTLGRDRPASGARWRERR